MYTTIVRTNSLRKHGLTQRFLRLQQKSGLVLRRTAAFRLERRII